MSKGQFSNRPRVSIGKRIGLIALIFLLIFSMLLGAGIAFVWSKLSLITYDDGSSDPIAPTSAVIYTEPDDSPASIDETEPEETIDITGLAMEEAPNYSDGALFKDKNVMNILLVGSDERTDGFASDARYDLNILVSINKAEKTVKLVSFSRCMAIKMLDGPYKGKYEWLTSAHRWAGPVAVMQAMEDAFKIELDRYVRVNFNSVMEIVNAIGGIEMELTEAEVKHFKNFRNWDFVVGTNHLNGWQALDYARLRSVDTDWGRIERQRRCILAVVDKLKGSTFAELNNLCDMVMPMIKTNLTMGEIAELILYSPKFLESEFDQMTIPIDQSYYSGMKVMSGSVGYALDYEKTNAVLHDFLFSTSGTG
ncbi:MAG: LCP family protein [Oscillospiraceae bacterium]|nr:LCP family protein [Oscillospiraceae bacterium]